MAHVVKDRVQETTTTTGTGTLTLGGAVSGFQTFSSAIGNTNTTYYTIQGGAEWEVGIGTVGAGTLSRDTILESSNAGSAVNFSAGTKFVFCTYPAEKSVDIDTAQTLTNKTISGASNTLSNIGNSSLTNSSITINGSAISLGGSTSVGTVTNVSALTLGTTGTDLSSTVATGTTTPVITLNVPTASATNRGALSSTDWSTFNGKQAALVSGTNIKTINSTSVLGSGDIAVQATLVSGTNIKTVNNTSLLGSGDLGTIGIAYGGTGATTAPAANAALTGFTTTATAAGTTTLTNTSSYYQIFTGTSTQTIVLPVTSTLTQGWSFHIVNNSTGNLTINSSGSNLVTVVMPNSTVMVTCILTSGTTAASWEYGVTDFSTSVNTGAPLLNQLIYANNAITATTNAATVPVGFRLNTVTNNSAATLTITMTTTNAVDGQMCIVRVLDATAVAQTISWVNTENSTVSVPTTSNGSTTLPLSVGFMYNNATSKWRCIASA